MLIALAQAHMYNEANKILLLHFYFDLKLFI